MHPRLILADQDSAVLEAWRSQFVKWPEVEVRGEDPLQIASGALLVPGNSFGFLDSGLEYRVMEMFGWELQDDLRGVVCERFEGEILVGQAVVVRRPSLPRPLVYAPIWRTPCSLANTVNVFLAVRAAYAALGKDGTSPPVESLVVPSMGVSAPGVLDARISARQIRYAYEMATGRRGRGDKNLSQLARRQRKLQAIPGEGKEEGEE